MAQARDAAFNPSSPHSSTGGADSYKNEGTPDTKLTVFSPGDNSARPSKLLAALNLSGPFDSTGRFVKPTEAFSSDVSITSEKDPFISSTTVPKKEQKLSPTASAFRPVSVPLPLVAHGSLNGLAAANVGLGANRQLFAPHATPTGRFSHEMGISRFVALSSSASRPITVTDVEDYLATLERLGSPSRGRRTATSIQGKVYLCFSNIRDARGAHENARFGSPDWVAEYIKAAEYYKLCHPSGQSEPILDGQLQITAFAQAIGVGIAHVETVVHTFLETQGEIFALQRQSEANEHVFQAAVEFSDADIAISVVQKFNGTTLRGVNLIVTPCHPSTMTTALQPVEGPNSFQDRPQSPAQDIAGFVQGAGVSEPSLPANMIVPAARLGQPPAGIPGPQQFAAYPVLYHGMPATGASRFMLDQTPTRGQSVAPMVPVSPISGGFPLMGPLFTTPPATPMAVHGEYTNPRSIQPYGRFDNRRQNAMRVHRSPYYNNAGHHNHVDVNRIRDGIDVRTTIMLRNIPNKVDQAMLKRIIDESSWGKYDFMYLRIDFANDCNVGYAFINFVDPLDIIDFVNARGNQRWNCFKSDKVAEISYATIQGKDCLVQKFRNSSVMLEAPHYRPKLYYTTNGPRPDLAGQEEEFPGPDNLSKMRRSCENAEHVGLFTPNSGQHFRDEQRRRRSQ